VSQDTSTSTPQDQALGYVKRLVVRHGMSLGDALEEATLEYPDVDITDVRQAFIEYRRRQAPPRRPGRPRRPR
jgi:hypothetical protein